MRRRALAIMIAALLLSCCNRTRYRTEEMTWSTDSRALPFHPLPPDAVRLTFVASPDDHVIVAGVPGLVDHLRRSGKTTVPVRFEVVCAAWGGHMRWFTMLSADGQSVVPSSALGGAERTGNSRSPHPLAVGCP